MSLISKDNLSLTLQSIARLLSNKANKNELEFKMDKTNPSGVGSFSLNRKDNTDIGDYSFAEGYSTEASGENSHAEGYYTTASGSRSHAEGYYTTASDN